MELSSELNAAMDAPYWAWLNKMRIDGRPFDLEGRGYQMEIMRSVTEDGKVKTNEVIRKGSQIGITMGKVVEIAHGALHGLYPQGIIYYFPSDRAVQHFSNTRFKPFIQDNEDIRKYCNDINAVAIRRIGKTNVNFFGCMATIRVGGEAKDSNAVRSTPADWILLDERDLFDPEMAKQVNQRLGNSTINRRTDIGTPKLPDDGVDLLYSKCLVPETKVLKTDLRWVRLSEIKEGDELIGFEEERVGKNDSRHYQSTKVIGCEKLRQECVRIILEDGTEVTASIYHRWLVQTVSRGLRWRKVLNLKLGDRLVSIGTWETGVTREDGYISGVYDGEAHLYQNKRLKTNGGATLGFSQNEGTVLQEVRNILSLRGFETKEYEHHKCRRLVLKGGLPEKLRFLGTYRPVRLIDKHCLVWEGVSVGHDHGNTKCPKIVKMEYAGCIDVIALTTDRKTFIANGLLSHNSDMRRWQIKCRGCGKHTCMESEFPDCIGLEKGIGYPRCVHCGEMLRRSSDGKWVPDSPTKDVVGYWASQLLNPNRDLAHVLKEAADPEAYDTNEAEFQRTVMGLPFVSSEERLSESDVYACCDSGYPMKYSHAGPCAAGVDIGLTIHVVIGHRIAKDRYRIVRIARVPDYKGLHDLLDRYHVKSCVIDAQPEIHASRDFQRNESFAVYLCRYSEHLKTFDRWNQENNMVDVNRTEVFNATHHITVSPGKLLIPRNCEEIRIFAHQMTCVAKVLEEDGRTGGTIYRYRKIGDKQDHYRNALNYFYLACKKVGIPGIVGIKKKAVMQDMEYSL